MVFGWWIQVNAARRRGSSGGCPAGRFPLDFPSEVDFRCGSLDIFNMKTSLPLTLTACISLLIGTGCTSFRFNRAWRGAGQGQPAGAERWEGHWDSDRHGNGGRLRAVVTPGQSKDDVHAFFEARWHGFTTAYEVPMRVERPRKGEPVLRGEHDLKSLFGGGKYFYKGTLNNEDFRARYESAYDTGTFELHKTATPQSHQ